jgi:hypothetical protein
LQSDIVLDQKEEIINLIESEIAKAEPSDALKKIRQAVFKHEHKQRKVSSRKRK